MRVHSVRMPAALSLVLVVIYGLRPLVRQPHRVRGSSHPLLGPQKTAGLITVLAGWATLFLGCAVVHYSWVRGHRLTLAASSGLNSSHSTGLNKAPHLLHEASCRICSHTSG